MNLNLNRFTFCKDGKMIMIERGPEIQEELDQYPPIIGENLAIENSEYKNS